MFPQNNNLLNDPEFKVTEQCENLSLRPNGNSPEKTENKGLRMMQKMGYTNGTGLGKNEQGIREPIIESLHLGNRGLGFRINNLENTSETWDFTKEEYTIEQKVQWLERTENRNFTLKKIKKWICEGPRKTKANPKSYFCDQRILEGVTKGKEIFDELGVSELNSARTKANPFEMIKSVFFINRAALKMANIDAATDFLFTNIEASNYHNNSEGPFYFADVCAGPGGFTEYVLWRRSWLLKGFGLTLRDENDFRLNDSTCTSSGNFQTLYGAKGDGNVCCPENIIDFQEKVLAETDKLGVHFMMSDGGFCVDGKENLQEILSKNIYICQCLVALEILREHGNFVTKLFDIFTTFSVGLLFLMYHCFEKVAIFKPNASRPANSERYFICANLRPKSKIDPIKKYLWLVVNRLWELTDNDELDVINIVPVEVIKNDESFYNFIVESNNTLGRKQILGLEKLAAFCRNPSLNEPRQEDLRTKCLHYWNIPNNAKTAKNQGSEEPNWKPISAPMVLPREIKKLENMEITVNEIEDWHYCPLYCPKKSNNCYFYAGVGFTKVYRYQRDKWVKVKNMSLTKGTLLYGEFVREKIITKSEDELSEPVESFKYSLHVIDAISLGETKLSDLKFLERLKLIRIYCKAVNREYQDNAVRLRAKVIKPLRSLTSETIIKKNKTNFYTELPLIGYRSMSETIDINSVLLLKSNENQTFNSTYVLRVQIFLSTEDENEENFSLGSLLSYVKEKS